MPERQQFFEEHRDLHTVGRRERVELQQVFADRQILLVGRSRDRAIDLGEAPAAFGIPLPDLGRRVGRRVGHGGSFRVLNRVVWGRGVGSVDRTSAGSSGWELVDWPLVAVAVREEEDRGRGGELEHPVLGQLHALELPTFGQCERRLAFTALDHVHEALPVGMQQHRDLAAGSRSGSRGASVRSGGAGRRARGLGRRARGAGAQAEAAPADLAQLHGAVFVGAGRACEPVLVHGAMPMPTAASQASSGSLVARDRLERLPDASVGSRLAR